MASSLDSTIAASRRAVAADSSLTRPICFSSEMSQLIFETPTIFPPRSRSGEAAIETSMRTPSLGTRTVS